LFFAWDKAGNSMAANMAMMGITTSNSMSVNALRGYGLAWFVFITRLLGFLVTKLKRVFFIGVPFG
jgi:hypothetical protein